MINFISCLVITFFSFGCVYFAGVPDGYKSHVQCRDVVYINAKQKKFNADEYTDVTFLPYDGGNRGDDWDPYVSKLVEEFSEITGCKVVNDQKLANSFIDLKVSSQKSKSSRFWPILTGITLGIIPYLGFETDSLDVVVLRENARIEFSINQDYFIGVGLVLLPVMPFSHKTTDGQISLAEKLSKQYCETSNACKVH